MRTAQMPAADLFSRKISRTKLLEFFAKQNKEIARRAREDAIAKRLMTIPGVGPITATAIAALAPPPEMFTRGRDFATWLDLAPRQLPSGGKQKLGAITKIGERTLRCLLIIGCSAVVFQAGKRGVPAGSWLEQMMAWKLRMLVTVAHANRTARIIRVADRRHRWACSARKASERMSFFAC